MTEENWTPGPWDTSRYHFPCRDIVARRGDDDNDARPGQRLICQVEIAREQEANAHLIAAAPDLYESIKEGIDSLEFAVRELAAQASLPDGELELCEERLTEMRTALSKARGETDEPNR